jgi:hypothetical protein
MVELVGMSEPFSSTSKLLLKGILSSTLALYCSTPIISRHRFPGEKMGKNAIFGEKTGKI